MPFSDNSHVLRCTCHFDWNRRCEACFIDRLDSIVVLVWRYFHLYFSATSRHQHEDVLDESTTPVEAALGWAIAKVRRRGGARGGRFPGADVVLEQLERGAPRCRVGLKPRSRAPVRAGVLLYIDASSSQSVGVVTSGTFGPSAAGPIAMGYVPRALSRPTTPLFADVRGNRLPVEVTELPFVPHRYKR